MSSTLILIGLLLSLSMAVILPEIQISKNQNNYAYFISPEYDSMVNKQRKKQTSKKKVETKKKEVKKTTPKTKSPAKKTKKVSKK